MDMFRSKGPSSSLALQDLAIKIAMLLVLTRPCRGADLAPLDLKYRSYIPEGVTFRPADLSKQSRPSHHCVEFFFPAFKEDARLCPVETLKSYEQQTEAFWKEKIDRVSLKTGFSSPLLESITQLALALWPDG